MNLRYFLVIPYSEDEMDVTMFQGWNPVVQDTSFVALVRTLACLPASLEELTLTQPQLLTHRSRQLQMEVIAVGSQMLSALELTSPESISVFVCVASDIPHVLASIRTDHKTLIVSHNSSLYAGAIDLSKLAVHPRHALDSALWLQASGSVSTGMTLREPYSESIQVALDHGVTAPNISLLESLGFDVIAERGVVLADHSHAVSVIIATFNSVMEVLERKRSEVILYVPAVKAPFYDFKSQLWNQLLRLIPVKNHRQFVQFFFRNPSFSGGLVPTGFNPAAAMADATIKFFLGTRSAELTATSLSIALMCAVRTTPSLRLPNSFNLFGKFYRELESYSKLAGASAEIKLQNKFSELNGKMIESLGESSRDLLLERTSSCTICSDAPIEWMYVGPLPLMISHEVSKIPMTPGNILLQEAASGPRLVFPVTSFKHILVIRSFSNSDPLAKMLENAVAGFPLSSKMIVKFVDVKTEAELIAALNDYTGYIVVFDCHGDHGGNAQTGWFEIGAERVVTWELAHRARIPPIVLLSACLTSAIGGSHASVSSGLLRCGALSVIGTLLPVDGIHSAIFIARLIYRLDAFLDALRNMKMIGISWRVLVSGFFKMSYVSDVLDFFCRDQALISEKIRHDIHLEANMNINSLNPEWYNIVLENLAAATGMTASSIVQKIKHEHPLMETMRYCQLGRPDQVWIDLR